MNARALFPPLLASLLALVLIGPATDSRRRLAR